MPALSPQRIVVGTGPAVFEAVTSSYENAHEIDAVAFISPSTVTTDDTANPDSQPPAPLPTDSFQPPLVQEAPLAKTESSAVAKKTVDSTFGENGYFSSPTFSALSATEKMTALEWYLRENIDGSLESRQVMKNFLTALPLLLRRDSELKSQEYRLFVLFDTVLCDRFGVVRRNDRFQNKSFWRFSKRAAQQLENWRTRMLFHFRMV